MVKIVLPAYLPFVIFVADKDDDMENKEIKNYSVLFVDDDLLILELYKIYFKTKGVAVCIASSGIEAVTIFKENKNDIDLIVSDFLMPDMTGIELTQKIKNIDPAIPVILTSGYMNFDYLSLSNGFPPDGYIEKPIDPDKLIEKIFFYLKEKGNLKKNEAQKMIRPCNRLSNNF